jgi:inosine-uridine nucleoside N-ribohydrolase
VVLGASSTTASAILKEPAILDRIHVVFHAWSDFTWPARSVQFNVKGDIHAARTLLSARTPLVWFDTGTHLRIPYSISASVLAKINGLGEYLHSYRSRNPYFMSDSKGFFDMGDIAYLIDPSLCSSEVIYAPAMDEYMFFNFQEGSGKMLRVFDIDNDGAWNLLFAQLRRMNIK